jgi:Protein of unknown function (DUF4038)/Putative collagen-binding domain of a collagenase
MKISLSSAGSLLLVGLAFLLQTVLGSVSPARAVPIEVRGRALYVDDRPFLINGDTLWTGLRMISESDLKMVLDQRKRLGFNTVVMDFAPFANDRSDVNGQPTVYGPVFNGNVRNPNAAYWDHVDRMLDYAEGLGFVVIAGAPTFCCDGWALHPSFDVEGARILGEFFGQRFKNRKIIWQYGGDNNPNDGQKARIAAMIGAIRRFAPNQPHVHHAYFGFSSTEVVSSDLISLNGTYTYAPGFIHGAQSHVYNKSKADYLRSPTRAFFLTESYYEGAKDGKIIRRQPYWSILSGSTGANYGHEKVCVNKDDWRNRLNDPGAQEVQHAFKLLNQLPWVAMKPDFDHKAVVEGFGSFNGGTGMGGDNYATTLYNSEALMTYAPDNVALVVDMSQFSGPVLGRWMDPTNGSIRPIGTFSRDGRRTFANPGRNSKGDTDWVLVLSREGAAATPTPIPPIATPTRTPVPTATSTPLPTATATPVRTPTPPQATVTPKPATGGLCDFSGVTDEFLEKASYRSLLVTLVRLLLCYRSSILDSTEERRLRSTIVKVIKASKVKPNLTSSKAVRGKIRSLKTELRRKLAHSIAR